MNSRLLPALVTWPAPRDSWEEDLLFCLDWAYTLLSDRSEEMILEGPDADKPEAEGKRRFYFATDTNKLYYDKGSWVAIN